MNTDEFVNFVNRSIARESGLRHITVEDIRNWTKKGVFRYAPEYYRDDLRIVLGLLQTEREIQLRCSARSQHVELAQADKSRARDLEAMFQKGITQVVTCVASSFADEQRIIQALKNTGLIGSAGRVAVE